MGALWLGYYDRAVHDTKAVMSVYARVQDKYIHNDLRRVYCVANLNVELSLQGKGVFSRWLARLESELSKNDQSPAHVYFENVLNEFLGLALERRGYVRVNEASTRPRDSAASDYVKDLTLPAKSLIQLYEESDD
jgi:hypothetical protein